MDNELQKKKLQWFNREGDTAFQLDLNQDCKTVQLSAHVMTTDIVDERLHHLTSVRKLDL